VTRPLAPAFLIAFAQALVDDATADPADGSAVSLIDSSAAFVHHAGYWSHFDHRLATSIWPLPCTGSCTDLADFAAEEGILMADAPEAGDIYLLWSPAKKLFARAGIVVGRVRPVSFPSGRTGHECLTIDACTTPRGSIRGPHTAVVQRVLSADANDRVIRWPMLESIPYGLANSSASTRPKAA